MPLTAPVRGSQLTTRPELLPPPLAIANGSRSDGALSLSRLHHCPTGPCHSRTVTVFDAAPSPIVIGASPSMAEARMYTRLKSPGGIVSAWPDGTRTFF